MLRISNARQTATVAAVAFLLAGCAAPRQPASSYRAPVEPKISKVPHQYTVTAVDLGNHPVAGVSVDVQLEAKGTSASHEQCTTDDAGHCPAIVYVVNRDPAYAYVDSYSSTAKGKATKDGYYPANASSWSMAGGQSSSAVGINDLKFRMIRPVDYLADGFGTSVADKELRERVLRFLDVIRVQSILVDADLMYKGIGTSEFKGKKYLRVRVDSTSVFNSLKLGKYDLGKRLYDDTVRKLLTPLNENIAAPKAYYGYDIVVYGHSKSFADKDAIADKVEYRFLLPEAAVRRYKEKDISGQALLDAGVELLDDERVEYKLQ